MIKSGGANVSPREVELLHRGLARGGARRWCSALPTPSGARRSSPRWCCARRAARRRELRARAADELSSYKVPPASRSWRTATTSRGWRRASPTSAPYARACSARADSSRTTSREGLDHRLPGRSRPIRVMVLPPGVSASSVHPGEGPIRMRRGTTQRPTSPSTACVVRRSSPSRRRSWWRPAATTTRRRRSMPRRSGSPPPRRPSPTPRPGSMTRTRSSAPTPRRTSPPSTGTARCSTTPRRPSGT